MENKREQPRRGNNYGGHGNSGYKNYKNNIVQNHSEPRGTVNTPPNMHSRAYHRDGAPKEGAQREAAHRDNQRSAPREFSREGGGRHNNQSRYNNQKIKVDETIEEIKIDISRIEKEIGLEIKEIKSCRLGL